MTRHHEEKVLPFTPAQMFDLVADVAQYPEFLPWTAAARIRSRSTIAGGEVMEADLVISFKLFRERFGSRVTLLPDEGRILTEYLDGPFRHLKSVWSFAEAGAAGCKVTFDVDFEFRNAILAGVIGLVFNEAMTRVVRAFETRAHALYPPVAGRQA
ncbi:type II toxin-antitoxin system RatA family toxin [bacterium]|nr:type II toxin-antitoxin system RatA family toxin [bacterium]